MERLCAPRSPELTPEQQRASTAPQGFPSNNFPSVEDSVIGSDLSIWGQAITIRCKGSLRVNGHIQTELHCAELLVGEQTMILGSIVAKRVVVSGRVEGTIVGDSVVLATTARVHGDISSRSLGIEEGALFEGRSRKLTDVAEAAPQFESTAFTP
jgi:cytoskeletal protein CcmA (bactofilin family)